LNRIRRSRYRPIVHVNTDGLTLGASTEPPSHERVHSEPNALVPRCADVAVATQVRAPEASRRAGIHADEHHVFPATLGSHRSPALPVRKEVEPAAKVISPGREHGDGGKKSDATHRGDADESHERSEAAAARACHFRFLE